MSIRIKESIDNNVLKRFFAHTNESIEEHSEKVENIAVRIIKKDLVINRFANFFNDFSNEKEEKKWFFDEKLFYDMLKDIFYCHDFGKISIGFQRKIGYNFEDDENNFVYIKNGTSCDEHSLPSSLVYYKYWNMQVSRNNYISRIFLLLNVLIIKQHHKGLCDVRNEVERIIEDRVPFLTQEYSTTSEEEKEQFSKLLHLLFPSIDFSKDEYDDEENEIDDLFILLNEPDAILARFLFFYTKYVFSLLVLADSVATAEDSFSIKNNFASDYCFEKSILTKDEKELLISKIKDKRIAYKLYSNPVNDYFNNKNNILEPLFDSPKELLSDLQSRILIETMQEVRKKENNNKNLFFLQAPTGAGKTNISFSFVAEMLLEHKNIERLIFVKPLNALIEQDYNELSSMLENTELLKEVRIHNSVSPFLSKEVLEKYKIALNKGKTGKNDDISSNIISDSEDYQFFNHKISLISHVALFDIMFGVSRTSASCMCNLTNSIIVMDEIHTYKESVWPFMMRLLPYIADIYNIKFLFMSATMPKLESYIPKTYLCKSVDLLKGKTDYSQMEAFKSRCNFNFELIDIVQNANISDKETKKQFIMEWIIEKILENIKNGNNRKFIVEFIRVNDAEDFYFLIKTRVKSGLITGGTTVDERNNILSEIKNMPNDSSFVLVGTQTIEAGIDIDMDMGFKNISTVYSEIQFSGRVNRKNKSKEKYCYLFEMTSPEFLYKSLSDEKYIYEKETRQLMLNDKQLENFNKRLIEDINSMYLGKDSVSERLRELLSGVDEVGSKCCAFCYKSLEKTVQLITNKTVSVFVKKEGINENLWEKYKKIIMHFNDKECEKDNDKKNDYANRSYQYMKSKISLFEIRKEMEKYLCSVYVSSQIERCLDNTTIEFYGGIYMIQDNGLIISDDGKINQAALVELITQGGSYFI